MSRPKTVVGADKATVRAYPLSSANSFNDNTSLSTSQAGPNLPSNQPLSVSASIGQNRFQAEDEETDKKKGIVVLPGVMGSRLYAGDLIEQTRVRGRTIDRNRNGTKLWIRWSYGLAETGGNFSNVPIIGFDVSVAGGAGTLLYHPEQARDILNLSCNSNGGSDNDVRTAGLNEKEFGEDKNDNNFGATGFYTDMVRQLRSAYSEKDVIFIPYDWRFGVENSATTVSTHINNFAKDYDILYIVAHSLGGLVACQYLKNNPSMMSKVRLITLGTPYYGAPKALKILFTGNALPMNLFSDEIRTIAPNIRSLYDLLPTAQYPASGKTYFARTSELIVVEDGRVTREPRPIDDVSWDETESVVRGFNSTLRNRSNSLHAGLNAKDIFMGMEYSCAVIGYGQSTIQRVLEKETITVTIISPAPLYASRGVNAPPTVRRHEKQELLTIEDSNGDGTVPLFSQTFGNTLPADRAHNVSEEHDKLASNPDIIQFVKSKILNWERPQDSSSGYNGRSVSPGNTPPATTPSQSRQNQHDPHRSFETAY